MSAFDAKSFYTFTNSASSGNSLSSGIDKDTDGAVNMTQFGSLSSENWQIYYQQGRYFIRNYDFGAGYQLGLDDNSRTLPTLMKTSGNVGQQWTLTRQDGKWTLANGLLGNGSWLAIAGINTLPGMQPSSTGAEWDIEVNPSAGSPTDPAMLVDVQGFEVLSTSSTLSSSATATPSSIRSTPSSAISSPTSSSIAAGIPSSSPQPSSKAALSSGAIAGIAVGGFCLLAACGLLGYFFWRKRRATPRPESEPVQIMTSREIPAEMHTPSSTEKTVYRYELG